MFSNFMSEHLKQWRITAQLVSASTESISVQGRSITLQQGCVHTSRSFKPSEWTFPLAEATPQNFPWAVQLYTASGKWTKMKTETKTVPSALVTSFFIFLLLHRKCLSFLWCKVKLAHNWHLLNSWVPFDVGWVTEGIKCKISKTLALHRTELAGISEQGKWESVK